MTEARLRVRSEFQVLAGADLREHSANKIEQWQFETSRYSPRHLPFLTIGQDTLHRQDANLRENVRAGHSNHATAEPQPDFLKILRQLGLGY